MADVTVVGLGLMGTALARALVKANQSVCVWNRTPEKATPLLEAGAVLAPTLADAIAASPAVIVCIDCYATTFELFGAPDDRKALAGRVLVHLTTGTPKDARDAEAWANLAGVGYLDGAILSGPEAIGTSDATILYSGKRDVFERVEPQLRALSPESRFVGENVGSAAAVDLAWLAQLYGTYVAAAHGAILCESEGVELDEYLAVLNPTGAAHWLVSTIRDDDYQNRTSTLAVWNAALRRVQEQAQDAGITSDVPDFVAHILDRAEAAGLGAQHVAAMVKVMRASGDAPAP